MIAGKAAGIFDDLAAVATEHAVAGGPRIEPDAHAFYQPLVPSISGSETLSNAFVQSARRTHEPDLFTMHTGL
jgi:hypothetical protein